MAANHLTLNIILGYMGDSDIIAVVFKSRRGR